MHKPSMSTYEQSASEPGSQACQQTGGQHGYPTSIERHSASHQKHIRSTGGCCQVSVVHPNQLLESRSMLRLPSRRSNVLDKFMCTQTASYDSRASHHLLRIKYFASFMDTLHRRYISMSWRMGVRGYHFLQWNAEGEHESLGGVGAASSCLGGQSTCVLSVRASERE